MARLTTNPAIVIPPELRGRFIVQVALALIRFWGRHKATLDGVIDPRLSTILDSLVDATDLVLQIAKPGPE